MNYIFYLYLNKRNGDWQAFLSQTRTYPTLQPFQTPDIRSLLKSTMSSSSTEKMHNTKRRAEKPFTTKGKHTMNLENATVRPQKTHKISSVNESSNAIRVKREAKLLSRSLLIFQKNYRDIGTTLFPVLYVMLCSTPEVEPIGFIDSLQWTYKILNMNAYGSVPPWLTTRTLASVTHFTQYILKSYSTILVEFTLNVSSWSAERKLNLIEQLNKCSIMKKQDGARIWHVHEEEASVLHEKKSLCNNTRTSPPSDGCTTLNDSVIFDSSNGCIRSSKNISDQNQCSFRLMDVSDVINPQKHDISGTKQCPAISDRKESGANFYSQITERLENLFDPREYPFSRGNSTADPRSNEILSKIFEPYTNFKGQATSPYAKSAMEELLSFW